MFEKSVWRDPITWASRTVGSRGRFLLFCFTMIGNAILLIGMEYLTLTVYQHRYAEHGERWELLARILAIGLASLIAISSYFPILLAAALRRVIRGRSLESGRQLVVAGTNKEAGYL